MLFRSGQKKEYVEKFSKGFWIDREQNEEGFDCQSGELIFIDESGKSRIEKSLLSAATKNSSGTVDCFLTIYEGKFHQVKRMFAQMGNEVVYLKRVKMGGLVLDNKIELGSYRELREEEIELLAGNVPEEE